jgi:ribonuclease Z
MSEYELIALGTSSQLPTRERNHNGYLLRWNGVGFLFDPGEGTQRQLTLAGIAVSDIHHICISHFHGDHCLGLAGIVQRLSLDRCDHPVHLYYPESGQVCLDCLCHASIYQAQAELIAHPVDAEKDRSLLCDAGNYSITAHKLDHGVPTIGFRVEEPCGLRFVAEKLVRARVFGPMVGELRRKGSIEADGKTVRLEEVSEHRAGRTFAFIMDTRPCPGASALAKDADLIVMEATYASEHADLADRYLHSTAGGAARTALNANARKLAIAHFSQRYSDANRHLLEAREIFPDVVALSDLDRIKIIRR